MLMYDIQTNQANRNTPKATSTTLTIISWSRTLLKLHPLQNVTSAVVKTLWKKKPHEIYQAYNFVPK